MVALTRRLHLGIIGEEHNDVDVVSALIQKLVAPDAFCVSRFVGHGCGLLRRKCGSWARTLRQKGCRVLIVVHDCDRNEEPILRGELSSLVRDCGFQDPIILIPVEELEAWLLCDPDAIKATFNMRIAPRIPASPESISDPKEWLGRLVHRSGNSEYINTVHNKKIAERLDIATLARCESFLHLPRALKRFVPRASRLPALG